MTENHGEYRGVGGWLAFFLVTLGILTPAFSVLSIIALGNRPDMQLGLALYPSLLPGEWILAAITTLIAWFAVYRFLRIFNWNTVIIGIGAIWTMLLIFTIGEPSFVSVVTGVPLAEILASMSSTDFARHIIYCSIWTLYLLKSRRVANTYCGRHPDGDALPAA